MPLVLDPQQALPELPQYVTSEDGRLCARVDEDHAGVVLRYDGDGEHTRRVRFTRDEQVVRSGDAVLAPGGVAYAYDAEPGLGAAARYTATPLDVDGTPGEPSRLALATGGTLQPGGLPEVWLTSMVATQHTRPVVLAELPELDYDVDTDDAQVLGSSRPVVVSAATASPTFAVTVISSSPRERHALAELLRLPDHGHDGTAPPVVLLRWEATSYQRQDHYAVVTSVTESNPAHARTATRHFEVELTTVDRPAVHRAPLRIPDYSYCTLAEGRRDYADVADWDSYADLLPRMHD